MKRRELIKYGLFGTGLLTAASIGLGIRATKLREPKAELKCFSLSEFSLLAAIAECIIPGDTFFPSAWCVAEDMDHFFLRRIYVQADFKALLHLIEMLGNGVLEQHPQTFSYSSQRNNFLLNLGSIHPLIFVRQLLKHSMVSLRLRILEIQNRILW